MIKKILVPVDGSESSEKAIKTAGELGLALKAKIVFLYVSNINQLAINACLSESIMQAMNEAGQIILSNAMENIPEEVEKIAVSQNGSPAVTILNYAKEENVDMIVMGSRGLGVVKGVLLGSVSQYLVEQAQCPVLVVK